MKITIWGNELPAWTSAAALAESGNHVKIVTGLDQAGNKNEIAFKISNEPGLQHCIDEAIRSGRLQSVTAEDGLTPTTHIISLNPDEYEIAAQLAKDLAVKHPSNLLIINQSHFGVGSTDKLPRAVI